MERDAAIVAKEDVLGQLRVAKRRLKEAEEEQYKPGSEDAAALRGEIPNLQESDRGHDSSFSYMPEHQEIAVMKSESEEMWTRLQQEQLKLATERQRNASLSSKVKELEAAKQNCEPVLAAARNQQFGWDVLMVVLAGLHIVLAPYTKVEESFNIQAMHDILFHQERLHKYDHFEFPGVVPRTFLGAIVVSMASYPFVCAIKLLELPKLYALYTVRFVLGALVLGTLYRLRQEVSRQFGVVTSKYFAVLTIVQFHLLFYCSRPLPNIFALALVNLAFSCWLSGSSESTLRYLVLAASVFRCDVILLLIPVGVILLLTRSISLWNAVKCCVVTASVSVGLSVAVDSIFWQRLIWPEFEVFWFNSVLNRSSEWGISPFHWYFTSALPRSMMAGLPLAVLGVVLERRTIKYVLSVLIFITLYSKLPHKELRFVLIGIPVLNIPAAAAMARLHNNRRKPRFFWRITHLLAHLMLIASFGVSIVMSAASYANYPGGHALHLLHSTEMGARDSFARYMHIEVLPAMTGVSRFCENRNWSYSKEEGISLDAYSSKNFTHLLNAKDSIPGFDCLQAVPGFTKLKLQKVFPQILVVKEPKVFIHAAKYLNRHQGGDWPGCDVKKRLVLASPHI